MNLFSLFKRKPQPSKDSLEFYHPRTLEECFTALDEWSLKTAKTEFAKMPEETAMGRTHMGLGMAIRNGWGLWDQKSVLARHFKERFGLTHADDMSGVILTSYHRYLNKKPLKLEEQAQYYLDWWKEHKQ